MDFVPRFKKLKLQTGRLNETRHFYRKTLDLPIVRDTASSVTIGFGATEIEFVESADPIERVAYHFALNIPENKIAAAVRWCDGRVPLIPYEQTGQPIVHFQWLMAHSIYFWDPSGNLVEFIAHQRLANSRSGEFCSDDVLSVAEFGLVVDNVDATSRELMALLGLECFADKASWRERCENDVFRMIGDPNGCFIVVRCQRVWLMTDIPAVPKPVEVTVTDPPNVDTSMRSADCRIMSG